MNALWCFHALWSSPGQDSQIELGQDKAVVGPAVGATHCLGDTDISSVSPLRNHVVNKMPMLGARVHQRHPVAGGEAEDGVRDQQVMLCAGLEKEVITVTVADCTYQKELAIPV